MLSLLFVLSGVIISVGNGTEHIRYIDQDYLTHSETYEYDMIIDALKQAGYTPDKNIIAFPVYHRKFTKNKINHKCALFNCALV